MASHIEIQSDSNTLNIAYKDGMQWNRFPIFNNWECISYKLRLFHRLREGYDFSWIS